MRAWRELTQSERFRLGALVHTVFVLVASGAAALAGSFWPGLAAGVLAAVVTAHLASTWTIRRKARGGSAGPSGASS